MQEIEKFEICSKYRREDFDFDEIQNDRNNPPDNRGYPTYPLLSSTRIYRRKSCRWW